MVPLYDENLGDTIFAGNKYLSGNIIMKNRDLVLSYLHLGLHNGDAKYRINSSKTETVTNITIHKINERIEYYRFMEITDYEGVIQVLINIRYTVIVKDTDSPIRNTQYSKRLVFCETNVRYPQ